MKDSLKKFLEGIVDENIGILSKNNFGIKRIVLFSSRKLTDSIREVLNYTENCLLSTQFKIDHRKIRVEVTHWYKPERHFVQGDYAIDIGNYLSNFPEAF